MLNTLTKKLVAILLFTSALLVVGMSWAIHSNFNRSFTDYATQAELTRLDESVEKLQAAYAKHGSWDFIRHNHRAWIRMFPSRLEVTGETYTMSNEFQTNRKANNTRPENALMRRHQRPPPPALNAHGQRIFGIPAGDRQGIGQRIRLIDPDKNLIMGSPDKSKNDRFKPIEVEGKLVAWIALTPIEYGHDAIQQSFQKEQLQAIYPIALGALLLALLIGIPAGNRLLRPISALSNTMTSLSKGNYEARTKIQSRDELEQLGKNVNSLAIALQRNESLRRKNMADVSHELRTPIACQQAAIEAMLDGIRPTNKEQLEKLHTSTLGINRLVGDLFQLAHCDTGSLAYRKRQDDVRSLLTQVIDLSKENIKASELELEVNLSNNLFCMADQQRLIQVFGNLISNSCRYTDKGGKLRISAQKSKKEKTITVIVEDSSPSVPNQAIPQLFDRFFRVENSRNRSKGGTGLGLAICQNIIDAHDGKIVAKSSELGGLHIAIHLPLISGM